MLELGVLNLIPVDADQGDPCMLPVLGEIVETLLL